MFSNFGKECNKILVVTPDNVESGIRSSRHSRSVDAVGSAERVVGGQERGTAAVRPGSALTLLRQLPRPLARRSVLTADDKRLHAERREGRPRRTSRSRLAWLRPNRNYLLSASVPRPSVTNEIRCRKFDENFISDKFTAIQNNFIIFS